jgi:hypothetical protein
MSIIDEITKLMNNTLAVERAKTLGLVINQVCWEDTGRDKDSCWGPNISDMTLVVDSRNMPIIRKPNFSDVTVDLSIDNINVPVGNETGDSELKLIPLREYLENISKYTNNKNLQSMYLDRDEKVICSSQACILPLKDGSIEFNVGLYNYQSYSVDDPAVLVITVSSQGTSCEVVKNGKTLLSLNKNGTKHNYCAKRLADTRKEQGRPIDGPMDKVERSQNVLYIVQVPLEVKTSYRNVGLYDSKKKCSLNSKTFNCIDEAETYVNHARRFGCSANTVRGIDHAQISAGSKQGIFTGTRDLNLKRDKRYPIRVTVQLYRVTDTSDISMEIMKDIATSMSTVLDKGENLSSLVLEDTNRPTEHTNYTENVTPASIAFF